MSFHPKSGEVEAWPFPDEPDTVAFTTSYVILDLMPVIHIVRDFEGNWQFLSREGADEAKLKLVALKTILKAHPEVREMANLNLGWEAWRSGTDSPWNKRLKPFLK